jgi:phage FluMu protein Com
MTIDNNECVLEGDAQCPRCGSFVELSETAWSNIRDNGCGFDTIDCPECKLPFNYKAEEETTTWFHCFIDEDT